MDSAQPAVILCDGTQFSHADLSHAARQFASNLKDASRTVGLVADRSYELVVGIFGILMSGRAYAPLSPDLPLARIRLVIDAARITTLALDPRHTLWGKSLLADLTQIVIPCTRAHQEHSPSCGLSLPPGLCAVMSTSGSTGRPKLVGVSSESMSHFLTDFNRLVGATEHSSILSLVSAAFVDHFSSVLLSIQSRSALVVPRLTSIMSGGVTSLIAQQQVTHIIGTPTMLQLLDAAACGSSVQTVVASGEHLPEQLLQHWMGTAAHPDLQFINVYGQTECTSSVCARVHSKTQYVPSSDAAHNIGFAYPSGELYVLEESVKAASSHTGELHYSGKLLCDVLDGPVSQAPNPFYEASRSCGPQMLNTGDLARRAEDGSIVLLGRADRRVKLRGIRIDLDELEAVVCGIPAVAECGVVIVPEVQQIVACCKQVEPSGVTCTGLESDTSPSPTKRCKFFKSARGCDWGSNCRYSHTDPAIELREGGMCTAVRRHCERVLPPYMVPSWFLKVDSMPLSTTTQKLDRKQLVEVVKAARTCLSGETASALTQLEVQVARVWEQVLGVMPGPFDSFAVLGGDSVRALRVVRGVLDLSEGRGKLTDQAVAAVTMLMTHPILRDYVSLLIELKLIKTKPEPIVTTRSESELETAAKAVDFDRCEMLVMNQEWPVQELNNALQTASRHGNVKMIGTLIEAKASPGAQNVVGATALHAAVHNGHIQAVEQLLKASADPCSSDQEGMTPLHHAALSSAAILELLIQSNSCIKAVTSAQQTALHFSARGGNLQSMKILLQSEALVQVINATDFLGRTALHWAVLNAHTTACTMLLQSKADVSCTTANTHHGREHYKDENCIQIAARTLQCNRPVRRVTVFDIILKAGGLLSTTTQDGNTVLHTVCSVVPEGMNVQWEPHMAMMGGVVARVIDAKADLVAINSAGRSPLHIAAAEGQLYAVCLLLNAGANLDVLDAQGQTPGQLAATSVKLSKPRWPHQSTCCVRIVELCNLSIDASKRSEEIDKTCRHFATFLP